MRAKQIDQRGGVVRVLLELRLVVGDLLVVLRVAGARAAAEANRIEDAALSPSRRFRRRPGRRR